MPCFVEKIRRVRKSLDIFKKINIGIDIEEELRNALENNITLKKTEWDLRTFAPDGELLDIGGCGEYTIMNNTRCPLIIIDNDPDRYIENKRVKTYDMDAQSMQFENKRFQNITIFYTLMYMEKEEIKNTLSECRRVLKESGHIYIWDIVFGEESDITTYVVPIKVIGKRAASDYCFASNGIYERRDHHFYKELIVQCGLKIFQEEIKDGGIYFDCVYGEEKG